MASVKTQGGATKLFPINIRLHQGSIVNLYLSALVFDVLNAHIQEPVLDACFLHMTQS